MADFSIATQTITGSSAVIRLAGDMDAHSFERLEEEFNKVLEAGVLGLVLDLSAFDSTTSAGLGAIVDISRMLSDRGGKLIVAAPRPKLAGLFDMLGLGEALTMAESLEQAKRTAASLRPA